MLIGILTFNLTKHWRSFNRFMFFMLHFHELVSAGLLKDSFCPIMFDEYIFNYEKQHLAVLQTTDSLIFMFMMSHLLYYN